jgi:hypothetical protein
VLLDDREMMVTVNSSVITQPPQRSKRGWRQRLANLTVAAHPSLRRLARANDSGAAERGAGRVVQKKSVQMNTNVRRVLTHKYVYMLDIDVRCSIATRFECSVGWRAPSCD